MSLDRIFATFANRTAKATGSPWAFILCLALVLGWAASGPIFQFSETWQLVINTGTTIITFLMVFLIQNTQNRDAEAMQTKLDALILMSDAEDRFVGIEKMTDKELESLRKACEAQARSRKGAGGPAAGKTGGARPARTATAGGAASGRKAARR